MQHTTAKTTPRVTQRRAQNKPAAIAAPKRGRRPTFDKPVKQGSVHLEESQWTALFAEAERETLKRGVKVTVSEVIRWAVNEHLYP